MRLSVSVAAASLLLSSAVTSALNLAQALKADKDLQKVAALNIPQWSQTGNVSYVVCAPTDSNITASTDPKLLGSLTFPGAPTTGEAWHYQIVTDVSGTNTLVWDNYDTTSITTPGIIHLRTGTGTSVNVRNIQADNGLIIVVDKPIPLLQKPSTTLSYLSSVNTDATLVTNSFIKAVASAGLTDNLDALTGYMILAPSDSAFAAVQSQVSALTPAQLKNVLAYHLVPKVMYSTNYNPGILPTLNGQTLDVTVDANGPVYNGKGHHTLADTTTTAGVIHIISAVLIPSNLDSFNGTWPTPVTPSSSAAPAASGTAASQTASAGGASTATPKSAAGSVAASGLVTLAVGALAAWIAL
ncbi:FAS1 domain-containing protein [Polychytrium aggregatum]|uniref:FAS1 domain-containing protein n=1 Tax=Polychytrium aggregatum TaxID=110093 RepID=UPI0022FF309F|nr:FAS1 domain-containing protein [Polychytrium aggregatum]KAI9204453.1 FAS1 domain-containing protein [Polychytrium aggregatum]